jgi:hypothetical protein
MSEVGNVRACYGSQSLAIPGKKALSLGHPHRRNFGYVTGTYLAGH